jgi:hypothetical protein
MEFAKGLWGTVVAMPSSPIRMLPRPSATKDYTLDSAGTQLMLPNDGNRGTDISVISCFLAGTGSQGRVGRSRSRISLLETRDAPLPGAYKPIIWIGHPTRDRPPPPRPEAVWPAQSRVGMPFSSAPFNLIRAPGATSRLTSTSCCSLPHSLAQSRCN